MGPDEFEASAEAGGSTRRTLLKGVVLGALGTVGAAGLATRADELLAASPVGREHEPGSDAAAVMGLVPLDAVTHAATGGPWTDPGTWVGDVPGDDARVHIPVDTTVTLDGETAGEIRTVRVDGTLRVNPTATVRLLVDTVVVTASGTLEVGTDEAPAQDVAVRFVDRGPIDEVRDPSRLSRGLLTIAGATVRMRGVERTPWTAIPATAAPRAGDAALELGEAPTGWQPGDRLVLAGLSPDRDEDEELTVQSVDGTTVQVKDALEYDHVPPREDLSAYVANLTRSVRFVSANDRTKRRGHVMFMNRDVDLRGVAFEQLGRTDKSRPVTDPANGVPPKDAEPNPQARYACHFHRTGTDPDRAPRVVRECVVDGSPGWGYVNHDSHVRFEDDVAYGVFGAAFVAEIGTESGTFKRNLALRSRGSGDVPDGRQFHEDSEGSIDDFGHGGYGFWFQGPDVAVEDNVAGGHRHFGYVYWTRGKPDRSVPADDIGGVTMELANVPVERVDGQPELVRSDEVTDGMVPSDRMRFRSFRGNTVFGSGGGIDVSRHRFGGRHDRVEAYSVVDDFTAYNLGRHFSQWDHLRVPNDGGGQGGYNGVSIRYSDNVLVRGARLVAGDGEGFGVGVNHNHAPSNVHVVDSDVEGFAVGVRAFPRGDSPIHGSRLDNDVDVQVVGGTTDRRWTPAQRVDVRDTEFGDGGRARIHMGVELDDDLYGLFAPEGGVFLDGDRLFFTQQAADYVPFPTADDLDEADGDSLEALVDVDPSRLVGKTNADLHREYGLAVEGRVAPEDAGPVDGVIGGLAAGGVEKASSAYDGEGVVAGASTAHGSLVELGRLAQGERLYVYDDESVFRTVPGKYEGLPYLRPEREDADAERPSSLAVDLDAPATVYVAYDHEETADWLGHWDDTGDVISTTDGKRRVYARDVGANTVYLGGCPNTHDMYSVFVEER